MNTLSLQHFPQSSGSGSTSSKPLAQNSLVANSRLQQTLTARAEKLEIELLELDKLLAAATVDESQDDPESEVSIPGAKKAAGLFPASEFLNPASPFYAEAERRSNYIANTNPHPLKPKDLEILEGAVRQENERLSAYSRLNPSSSAFGQNDTIDLDKNTEGLDWERIAEKVSDASSVKRNSTECRIAWIADKHPSVNHSEWSSDEIDTLNTLISEYTREKKAINWVKVAENLGTHRVPIDCMRHGIPRHRHTWSPETDEKLVQAVAACGVDNWQLVARTVSEHVSAGQCQNRWHKTLCPSMRKGSWTEEEDDRLRKAVAGYGISWMQVASAIPGRTNDQCRERWTQHVNVTTGKIEWSPEEDQILLDSVKEMGNMWKAISVKLGGNKTGQSCRMRYDKLIRNQKTAQKLEQATASSSTLPEPGALLPEPSMHEFSLHDPDFAAVTTPIHPPDAGKGKGKAMATPESSVTEPENASRDDLIASETPDPPATKRKRKPTAKAPQLLQTAEVAEVVPPRPRPKPRPRLVKATVVDSSNPPDTPVETASTPQEHPDIEMAQVASPAPAKGRKRKLPLSSPVDEHLDKPLPKKARVVGTSRKKKVPAKKPDSRPSASSTQDESMDVDENDTEAADKDGAEVALADSNIAETESLPPIANATPQEDLLPGELSETMDMDNHDNLVTQNPRKRGRPRKGASNTTAMSTTSTSSVSPSTRRSARLRK